jgi:hypothetical protein
MFDPYDEGCLIHMMRFVGYFNKQVLLVALKLVSTAFVRSKVCCDWSEFEQTIAELHNLLAGYSEHHIDDALWQEISEAAVCPVLNTQQRGL